MAERIDHRLLQRLREKLGISRSAAYAQIEKRARAERLPRDLAAISLAGDSGINITKYATPEQLATLRGVVRPQATPSSFESVADMPRVSPRPYRDSKQGKASRREKGNKVFVVHGRNEKLRKAMFAFLRAIGVQPIEWAKAISYSKSASPHVSEILEAAFKKAQAVVVLMTPDDEAKLRDEYIKHGEPAYERRLTGQARPNVLFEAGMAFGTHSRQTVLVEFGKLRPTSDIVGRHTVRMNNSQDKRKELMVKLQNAGCEVDFVGSDWLTEGDFTL